MDIKPVDVQMFINRSSQINKSEDSTQKHLDQNLMFAEHFRKNIETDNKKTLESNKSEKENVDKDSKNNRNFNKRDKNNKKEDVKKEEAKKEKLSFLNISI